ncbi:DUF2516 family protein [Streptomyces sp. NPDC001941]|uniref:DUF2516 family protein n=1 Tax=Streptomyces sp. NPDC001941 TaxID=3154659 RepID=UPI00332A1275
MLIAGFSWFMLLLNLAMLVFAAVALAQAVLARGDAYRAADKQSKKFWTVLLGITLLVNVLTWVLPSLLFLQIAGLVATIVFTVDVRPALRRVTGGGRRGSSSDGPYGPYNGGR